MIFVQALVFEKQGIENLRLREIDKPAAGPHDVLIGVRMAGVNPIDNSVVNTRPDVKPMPHIPGAEFAGTIEEIGSEATTLRKGDRVIVYGRVFDSTCDMCLSNSEMLCRNGGIMSVITNGAYAEYVAVPERNAFRVPDTLSWEVAASLPVCALTPYHALKKAQLSVNENLVVFGASGSTGMFAVQLGRRFGANVIAVSRKDWVKELGADHVFNLENPAEKIREATSGKMADVVLNSIGAATWSPALDALGPNGRLVFFGTLTGGDVSLPLNKIYSKQAQMIGTTGGTRKELLEIISMADSLRVKVWRKFKLEDGAAAMEALSSKERDGRILIEP